jgi:hypothetical protein
MPITVIDPEVTMKDLDGRHAPYLLILVLLLFLGQLGCHSSAEVPTETPAPPVKKEDGLFPEAVWSLYKGERSTLQFCVAGSSGIIYDFPGMPGEREIKGGLGLEWTFGVPRRR